MKTSRVQAGVGLVHSGDDQDEGYYTSTEGESSRLEGQVETAAGESSQQQHDEQEKPLTFERTVTKDSLCLILANLHPRDGLKVLCLCCSIRSLAGKELWEWWALALWPERLVLPTVPRLYPDIETLVRDDNRRGTILTLKWPDVGNDQTVCFYTGNRPWYYFACRVLAVEYDRHQNLLSVHFDVRGESDLVKPGNARILLASDNLEIEPPIPHEIVRAIPERDAYRAVPLPSVEGVEGNIDYEWGYCWTDNKRCIGHVTFDMTRFEECLHQLSGTVSAADAHLKLKFVYSMNPSYTHVTLAEWPQSELISFTEVLTEHSCHGPEICVHITGEMSRILDASEANSTADYAKKRFDFVPDYVRSRPEWWV